MGPWQRRQGAGSVLTPRENGKVLPALSPGDRADTQVAVAIETCGLSQGHSCFEDQKRVLKPFYM